MLRNILNRIPRPKRVLIDQLQTGDNQTALDALHKLQAAGWTQDGTLAGMDLQRANLESARLARADMAGVVLRGANLQRAYFGATNLHKADLQTANLKGANLGDVQLSGANLAGADLSNTHLASGNLRDATLQGAILESANLWQTDLRGANLHEARLENANLAGTKFDEHTTLPDGTRWTTSTDMRQYTDYHQPDD